MWMWMWLITGSAQWEAQVVLPRGGEAQQVELDNARPRRIGCGTQKRPTQAAALAIIRTALSSTRNTNNTWTTKIGHQEYAICEAITIIERFFSGSWYTYVEDDSMIGRWKREADATMTVSASWFIGLLSTPRSCAFRTRRERERDITFALLVHVLPELEEKEKDITFALLVHVLPELEERERET